MLKGHVKLVRDQNELYGAPGMKQNLICSCFLLLFLFLHLVHYLAAQIPAMCNEWAAKLTQDWIFQRQCKSIYCIKPFLLSGQQALWRHGKVLPWSLPTSTIPFVGMHEVAILTQATETPREIGTALAATPIQVLTFIYIWKEKGIKLCWEEGISWPAHWSLHIHLYLERKGNKTLCWEEGITWPAANNIQ